MDKNPRQITRLRVEDQKRLEDLATEVVYNEDTNTTEIGGNLEVDGETKLNKLSVLNTDAFNDGIFFNNSHHNAQHIGVDNNTFYFEIVNEEGEFTEDYAELDIIQGRGDQYILTSGNTKTLFGNKNIYGTGNIDLYRHQLTGSLLDNNVIYMQIISSRNTLIDSIQDLTSVTKATSGYVINGIVRVNGIMNAAYIYYNGSTWNVSYNDTSSSIKTINDTVTTI